MGNTKKLNPGFFRHFQLQFINLGLGFRHMCIWSFVVLKFLEKEKDSVEASSALELLKKMVLAAGTSQLINLCIAVVILSQIPCQFLDLIKFICSIQGMIHPIYFSYSVSNLIRQKKIITWYLSACACFQQAMRLLNVFSLSTYLLQQDKQALYFYSTTAMR